MSSTYEQFSSLLLKRRQSQRSLTESFYQAQEIIGIPSISQTEEHSSLSLLLKVSEKILQLVEQVGIEKATNNQEPEYHNRQHFADAVLALSFLLSHISELSIEDKQLLLITMLVHDFGHRGLGNKPLEGKTYEEESIDLLSNTPLKLLRQDQQDLIYQLIAGTTPNLLEKTNALYQTEPTNLKYLKQALINDADIATSYIPNIGPILTKCILLELGNRHPSDEEIESAYLDFKKQFTLTSQLARSIFTENT